eukprot:4337473-Pyramimonas_sp.AAC.1
MPPRGSQGVTTCCCISLIRATHLSAAAGESASGESSQSGPRNDELPKAGGASCITTADRAGGWGDAGCGCRWAEPGQHANWPTG